MLRTLVLSTLALALLAGCQSLPKSISAITGGGSCLTHVDATNGVFTAYASGPTLEKAKINARSDLAQQISSNISSVSENSTALTNGRVNEHSVSSIRSESKYIPIDGHRIDQTCKSGSTHYVRASLSQKTLVSSSQSRLKQQISQAQRTLKQARRASSYERYLSRGELKLQLDKLLVLNQLLQQYDDQYQPKRMKKTLDSAQKFIDKNKNLRINIKAYRTIEPLLPTLEGALRKAELDYGRRHKNSAIDIELKVTPNYKKGNGRHITNLSATLFVRRVDTGELLSKISLGEKTGTSSIDQKTSLKIALKAMNQQLRRQLQGDKTRIRQKLGII